MEKRNPKNSELDAIAAKLLRSAMPGADAIEHIVSGRQLFESVNSRIAAEAGQRQANGAVGSGFSFGARSLAGSFAVLAIVAAVFAYIIPKNDEPIAAIEAPVHEEQIISDDPAQFAAAPVSVSFEPPAKRRPVRKLKQDTRKAVKAAKPRPVAAGKIEEFYALNGDGNLDDRVRDGKVLRVDMSPSSLYSLGVNLPLENGAASIKTELLVGPDGVAHAIRLVD